MSGADEAGRRLLAQELRLLPDEWLVAVLRQVFAERRPQPEDDSSRNRYFLGRAVISRDPRTGARTGPPEYEAVGHPDRDYHGDGVGPDWGLCQSGTCASCSVAVVSNQKRVCCPLCDGSAYLT
jgi:hypothetical protein